MHGPDSRRQRNNQAPKEIIIDGSAVPGYRNKIRHLVRIDGKAKELPYHIFRVFAVLALRRDIDGGWTDRSFICCSDETAKCYIRRTREILQPAGSSWMVIEPNALNLDSHFAQRCPAKPHQYRLAAEPETIRMNPRLIYFDDIAIAREAKAFIERAVDRLMCPQPPTD